MAEPKTVGSARQTWVLNCNGTRHEFPDADLLVRFAMASCIREGTRWPARGPNPTSSTRAGVGHG